MKKIFSILFILLLLIPFLISNINLFAEEFREINYNEETRKPAVSGIFYPGSAEELKEKIDSDSFYQGLSYGNYYLCGGAAVGTLLKIAENLQVNKIKLLKYANSGDITGDRSRVVGYAALALYKNNPEFNNLKEAYYYLELGDSEVQCLLCPRECILEEGERGVCGVRQNIKGKLYTLVYGRPVAVHVDPIEKKPISHMLPGSKSFSIATAGCNLGCLFCQNWQISQVSPEEIISYDLPPEKVVQLALENNCQSIAYTYSEPTIFYEYMIETAKLARQKDLKNIYVTSGYINPEPLRELCKYIDAANLDIKGFTEDYYRKYCLGKLQPVLESAKIMKEEGVWIELTNLILPTINDDMEVIREMCEWIIKNLGPDVPLYFSRFYPNYKITHLPPTPVETLEKAREIALDVGLHYVYIGNVPGNPAEHTYCPNCGKLLIQRVGFFVTTNNLNEDRCPFCGEKIPGIWK